MGGESYCDIASAAVGGCWKVSNVSDFTAEAEAGNISGVKPV
jgi:hypothetical protein